MLATAAGAGAQGRGRFVGESRCGNPTCHGAALPATTAAKKDWRPWKSARTQWLDRNIDRHSRAFATLETEEGKTIARTMRITATASDKCLSCHGPAAENAAESRHRRQDGVSCEHCHGGAEAWLKPHVEKDWPQKRAQYVAQGFFDNDDYRRRAANCARCHVDLDHEIAAGGHPPLQFEMVAYAQIMKHWDDQDELPAGSFSADPTLWSIGQLVGLRRTAEMVAARAGGENYQGIEKFGHFKDANCYQCHHKLVNDAVRQARGHYLMADVIVGVLGSDARDDLATRWKHLLSAVDTSPDATRGAAAQLAELAAQLEGRVAAQRVDQAATRRLLDGVTSGGDRFKTIERSGFTRPPTSNVLRLSDVGQPWWYTTGAPEQAILAILSLCEPAFPGKCGGGPGGIEPELKALLAAVDRFNYDPVKFAQPLAAVRRKLFR
jgi:hypothetical protein